MPRERAHHGTLYAILPPEVASSVETPVSDSLMVKYDPFNPEHEGLFITEEPSLDINWDKEGGYVQFSIDAPREWWEKFIKEMDEMPGIARRAAYTGVLTRQELNGVIRTTRRARDAAYEADE